jgi:acetyltransferase-like isoleucine patch superfamily enzyme
MIDRLLRGTVRRSRVAFYRAISTGEFTGSAPRLVSPVLIIGQGTVAAEGATIGYWPTANLFDGVVHIEAQKPETRVEIGAGTTVNNGAVFAAEGPGIEIGRDVLIGRNTEIYDSDRHELDPQRRDTGVPNMGKVVIEDRVFIGSGVKIGKGVRIGQDSVIGMGSVVVTDIPPRVIAAGNPCRVIRNLDQT